MQVTIPGNVKELVAKRGLKESDIIDVVNSAEKDKKYIRKGSDALAKKKIGNVMVYVMCDLSGKGTAVVKTAYSHKMNLGKVVNLMADSEWKTADGKSVSDGHIEVEYMTVKRNAPALVVPETGDSFIEEYLAVKTIAAAEGLFEKKRA